MALAYVPKVGELLECDFGEFAKDAIPAIVPAANGTIASEIRKKRMVVVINAKLANDCCLVIPVSSTGNPNAVTRGFHVHLDPSLVPVTSFYDKRDRWALAECMTHVSKERLFMIKEKGVPIKTVLPRDVVADIQKSAIKVLNASALLAPVAPAPVPVPVADSNGSQVAEPASAPA